MDIIGFLTHGSVSNTTQKNIKNLQIYELLNNCYETLKNKNVLEENREIVEMYFIRYIVWFLLFSTKKVDSKTIKEEYKKIFYWLEERFPNYKKNKLLGITTPKGEILSVRLTVYIFMLFHKLHLGEKVLCIYSKI